MVPGQANFQHASSVPEVGDTFQQLAQLGPLFAVLAIAVGAMFWLYLKERSAHMHTVKSLLDLSERSIEAHTKAAEGLSSLSRQIDNIDRRDRR